MGKKITPLQLLQAAALATLPAHAVGMGANRRATGQAGSRQGRAGRGQACEVRRVRLLWLPCADPGVSRFRASTRDWPAAPVTAASRTISATRPAGRRRRPISATCGALPQEPVRHRLPDGLATHRSLRKEAGHRPVTRSGVRPADDAARLHEGAQPAALARLRAARPVRRRPRVRRPLRPEGRLALPREERRQLQGLGRPRGQLPGQHRPEAVQARHRRRGESRLPLVQDAGPHPRMGVHGRPGSGRQVEPHVEGRRDGEGR